MTPKKTTQPAQIPKIVFGKRNILIFASGIPVLMLGFYLMTFGPWDNPLSRSVSPLILLLGYLVIFPIAILYRDKQKSDTDVPEVSVNKKEKVRPKTVKVTTKAGKVIKPRKKEHDRRAVSTQRKSHPTLDRRKEDRRNK